MLPKKNRADKKAVAEVFKEGKFLNSGNLTFKFVPNSGLALPRISVIVPKTISKKAVERNFLRRRGYRILKKYLDQFPAKLSGVFIFKKPISSILEIENEIKIILSKLQ